MLNKAKQAILKALSAPHLQTQKSYPLQRRWLDLTRRRLPTLGCHIRNHRLRVNGRQIPMRIFSPEMVGEFPILLFFHGGGWVIGNLDNYHYVCANLSRHTRCTVVAIDYRLAPEARFPAGLEDCYAALQAVIASAPALGGKSSEVTLIGDSAGGNLAAAVSLMARDRGGKMPKNQILIYPVTWNDHSAASPFDSVRTNGQDYLLTRERICDFMALYKRDDRDLQSPYLAPLLAEDLKDQPNTLILTAQYDPLRDEGEAYGRRLAEAGNRVTLHRVQDALHGFFSSGARTAHVQEAYLQINRFLHLHHTK